jgi:hypothetical protein
MNSESYIKQALEQLPPNDDARIYTSQELQNNDKNKKRLLNSAKVIGQGIEAGNVIGLIDISLFHDGKEGTVFTGTDAYVRESFAKVIHINLENFDDIEYKQTVVVNEKGKEKKTYHLSFTEDGELKEYTSEVALTGVAYELTAEVLADFNSVVKDVKSTEQDVTLEELGEDAVLAYLKVVYRYLKADGKIEHREMLNIASLLAQLEVSDSLEEAYRDYRFDNDNPEDMATAVDNLKVLVPEGSQQTIFQSLINDLLGMKDDEGLETWENDTDLSQLMDLLSVTKEQAEFFVRNQQLNNRQIKERLEDDQVKDLAKQLAGLGAGAGASVAALAATGAAVGAFGTYGLGSLAIATMSTGGLALAAVGIGAAGIAGYKGIQYLTSANGKEKYAIRNELLQSHVLRLTRAQQFLMSDINRFTEEMNALMADKDAITTQYDKIKSKLIQISETTKAGQLAKTGATDLTREQILSELPAELNEDKLNDLLKTRASGEKIANFIKTAYPDNKLNENLSTRDLERLQAVLTQIEYGKVATVANVKEKFGSFLNKVTE